MPDQKYDPEKKQRRAKKSAIKRVKKELRRQGTSVLPSNVNKEIQKARSSTYKRGGAGRFNRKLATRSIKVSDFHKSQRDQSKVAKEKKEFSKNLKKTAKQLKNQNLNRVRRMAGDSGFSSRNKFSKEDNKRVSKPEF